MEASITEYFGLFLTVYVVCFAGSRKMHFFVQLMEKI